MPQASADTPTSAPTPAVPARATSGTGAFKHKPDGLLERLQRVTPFALPRPHFMNLAPLDTWARLLWHGRRGVVRPYYWVRLGACLFVSTLSTLVTLPERVFWGVVWRVRLAITRQPADRAPHCAAREPARELTPAGPGSSAHAGAPTPCGMPDFLVVLGFFRSGTTHLHYLLSCDPRVTTPAWHHTLAPHAFVGAWGFLRVLLIPFLSSKRPMDDMAFGPGWPAEDDFALNAWGALSPLPGKFVFPGERGHDYFSRFHSLQHATTRERARWRSALAQFLWRLSMLSGGRTILLKSPSHLARLDDLLHVVGPAGTRVKFVHISRDPDPVIRSNVAMGLRMHGQYGLEPSPEPDVVRARLEAEYADSEERYLRAKEFLPAGSITEVRFEDLRADPIGTLRAVYRDLELPWSTQAEGRFRVYLESVRDYTPATKESRDGASRPLPEPLARLKARFRHDQPPVPKQPAEAIARDFEPGSPSGGAPGGVREALSPRPGAGLAAAVIAALVGAGAWVLLGVLTDNRNDWGIWMLGLLVGWATLKAARLGSRALAWAALACAVVATLVAGTLVTGLVDLRREGGFSSPNLAWRTWHELRQDSTLFWLFMGWASAWKLGGRTSVTPGTAPRPARRTAAAGSAPADTVEARSATRATPAR